MAQPAVRIAVRTSRWALWARRLGTLPLPMAGIGVFLHRAAAISSEHFVIVEAVAAGMALVAIVAAGFAFAQLWQSGDRGWGYALVAAASGLLSLTPVGFVLVDGARGGVTDIATDPHAPPLLVAVQERGGRADALAATAGHFPEVQPRHYALDPPQVYEVMLKLGDGRGWDLRATRRPLGAMDDGGINAVEVTLLGFREEIAMRVVSVAEGSLVDMRSSGLSSVAVAAGNVARIESFLSALDAGVAALAGQAASAQ